MEGDRYANVYCSFWDELGPAIVEAGGADALSLSFYLLTNRDATMIGLYSLDLHRLRDGMPVLTQRRLAQALKALELIDFAQFDNHTRMVWVREMARDRLQLQAKPLAANDNRMKAVHRLYASARPNPFLSPFYDRYRNDLHLPQRRTFTGERQSVFEAVEPSGAPDSKGLARGFEGASSIAGRGSQAPPEPLESPSKAPLKALPSPFEAPSKPEYRDQLDLEQGSGSGRAVQVEQRAETARDIRKEAEDYAVIEKLVHVVLDEMGDNFDDGALAEDVKVRSSRLGLNYNTSATIQKAIASARTQRQRRRLA